MEDIQVERMKSLGFDDDFIMDFMPGDEENVVENRKAESQKLAENKAKVQNLNNQNARPFQQKPEPTPKTENKEDIEDSRNNLKDLLRKLKLKTSALASISKDDTATTPVERNNQYEQEMLSKHRNSSQAIALMSKFVTNGELLHSFRGQQCKNR
jgi:hypothetical protein